MVRYSLDPENPTKCELLFLYFSRTFAEDFSEAIEALIPKVGLFSPQHASHGDPTCECISRYAVWA